MTIFTIKQRFSNSVVSTNCLNELKKQKSKSQASFDWTKRINIQQNDYVSISNLYIDDETQRDPFDPARVVKLKQMVSKPCSIKFGRVVIAQRPYENDNRWFVVDGQGRTLAAYAMGENEILCDKVRFNSKQDETAYFLSQGKGKHAIKDWEKHSVVLNLPKDKNYTTALDIQRVISTTNLEYKAEKISDLDASDAYSGIRDSIRHSDNSKPGSRKSEITIGIINLMKKYGGSYNSTSPLKLRSDLFYPLTEFVLKTAPKSPIKTRLAKLEQKLINKKNQLSCIDLDTIALHLDLGAAKNVKDKRATWKKIKTWK